MDLAIIGLGNYGDKYKNTRHNIGWIFLERYLEKINANELKSYKNLYKYSIAKVKNKEAVGMFLKINKAKDNLTLDELTKTLVKKNEYKYLPYVFKKGATQKKEYIDYAIKNGLFNTAVNLINSYDKDKLDRICQNPHYRSYIEDVRVCAKYLESEKRKREEPASGRGQRALQKAKDASVKKPPPPADEEPVEQRALQKAKEKEMTHEEKREGDDARRKKRRR